MSPQALKLIANAEGWSREDILAAAKILRAAIEENPTLSATVEPLERSKARDQILKETANSIGFLMLAVGLQANHKVVQRLSEALENFRLTTL
jgi:type III secretion system FlhB-like substrate exporter